MILIAVPASYCFLSNIKTLLGRRKRRRKYKQKTAILRWCKVDNEGDAIDFLPLFQTKAPRDARQQATYFHGKMC